MTQRRTGCSVPLTVPMSQFADGVYLVLLMGLLEGYFVPLYNFFLTPENFDQKVKCVHNHIIHHAEVKGIV